MDVARGGTQRSLLRIALLAVFATAALLVLSFLLASPASAADDDEGSGLLGAVGSTANAVGGTVDDTADAAGDVVGGTVETVAPAAEPVVEAAPEPVREPVAQTVDTVADGAGTTVERTDTAVSDVVDAATDTVSEVAASKPVTTLTEPVVDLVSETPVVGGIVKETGADDAVDAIAEGVDGTVADVVGEAPESTGILPTVPTDAVGPLTDLVAPEEPAAGGDGGLITGDGGAGGPGALPPVPLPIGTPAGNGPAVESSASGMLPALFDPIFTVVSIVAPIDFGTGSTAVEATAAPSAGHPALSDSGAGAPGTSFPGSSGGLSGTATGAGASGSVDGPAPGNPQTPAGATSVSHPPQDAVPGGPTFDTDVSPD